MFEVLFAYPKVLARHQAGPAAADRERYLVHCAGQGAARETLLRIAQKMLVIAERIEVTAGEPVTRSEIDAAARAWARQQKRRRTVDNKECSRHLFTQVAVEWLRFLGILEDLPHAARNAFSGQVDDFIAYVSLETTNVYAEIDFETKAKALAKCETADTSATRQH
jgi:integrase/recombinase XerD